MKAPFFLTALWILANLGAHAAPATPDACEQMRTHIQAVTGLVTMPDKDLLSKLSTLHRACQFTSAEVYRAAYGDTPQPALSKSRYPQRHESEDD
jgi:hypothetical protein